MVVHSILAATEPARVAVPAAAKQAEVEQRIRSIFKAEYADRTMRGRVNLARRLLREANSTTNDPNTSYVLLREARDRAADAGNLPIALDAIDAMDESFIIDALPMKGDVVSRAGPTATNQGDYADVVNASMEVMDDAVASDRFDVAMKLTSIADTAASKTKSMVIITEVDARVKEIRLLNGEYSRAKSAMTVLKTDPNNPAANLAAGRYIAVFKSNWEDGLPMLAKGSDAAIRAVAALDLENPTEPAKEFAVGNAWWDVGEKSSDLVKTHMRERAGYWYRQAYPGLAGLDKTQAEKRLTDIGISTDNLGAVAAVPAGKRLEPGLFAELYTGMDFRTLILTRVDPTIAFEWGRGGPDPKVGGGKYSIRWSGILMVPRGGVSAIGVSADDGVHVFIDENPVLRQERAQPPIFRSARLSAGAHTIRIEYFNKLGVGRMKLLWTLNAYPGEQTPVPADALVHVPRVASW